jgi:hypothetical protein
MLKQLEAPRVYIKKEFADNSTPECVLDYNILLLRIMLFRRSDAFILILREYLIHQLRKTTFVMLPTHAMLHLSL